MVAGFLFCVGGLGVILLNQAHEKATELKTRYFIIGAGGACFGIAYLALNFNLRIKIPYYFQ